MAEKKLYYIEILDQNESGGTITTEDLGQWADKYENGGPVLGDVEQEVFKWAGGSGYPTVWAMDQEMVVQDTGDDPQLYYFSAVIWAVDNAL